MIRPLSDFLPQTLGGALCAAFFGHTPPNLSWMTACGSRIARVVNRQSGMTVGIRSMARHCDGCRVVGGGSGMDGPMAVRGSFT